MAAVIDVEQQLILATSSINMKVDGNICRMSALHSHKLKYSRDKAFLITRKEECLPTVSSAEAAKMLEKDKPEDATGLYEKAAETVSTEDRPNVAAEYMGKAARLYVRTKNFDSALTPLLEV